MCVCIGTCNLYEAKQTTITNKKEEKKSIEYINGSVNSNFEMLNMNIFFYGKKNIVEATLVCAVSFD